jgi:hypothetical protein
LPKSRSSSSNPILLRETYRFFTTPSSELFVAAVIEVVAVVTFRSDRPDVAAALVEVDFKECPVRGGVPLGRSGKVLKSLG